MRKKTKTWRRIKNELGYSSLLRDKRFRHLTGKKIQVCIIDSGYTHNSHHIKDKAFLRKKSHGYINEMAVSDDLGHGTMMTGIISSKFGCSPNAKFFHRKIYGFNSPDPFRYVQKALNDILEYEEKDLPDILNLSVGNSLGYSDDRIVRQLYGGIIDLLKILKKRGVVIVASAGNNFDGNNNMTFPGISRHCISVGALDPKRDKSQKGHNILSRSQFIMSGKFKTAVFAPGHRITTINNDAKRSLVYTSGTSPATALVTSAITLFKEYYNLQKNDRSPVFNNKLVRQILQQNQSSVFHNGKNMGETHVLDIHKSLNTLDKFNK